MNKIILLLLAILALAGTTGLALEITSVAPQRAFPDTVVTVSGGPFSSAPRVLLGEQPAPARQIVTNQLEFVVPALPPGSYTLAIHDNGEIVMAHFIFEVLPLTPEITGIVPDNLDYCADAVERVIQVQGRNFQPETVLLLDGKVVPSRILDSGELEFRVPELPAGVYGVEARHPNGTASLPHSLWINSVPEITSVERGPDMVNNYDLVIRGKNFFYNSILLVREPENPATGRGYRLSTLQAGVGDLSRRNNPLAMPGEGLLYENCGTLVYRRYPFDMQEKDLLLQVVNPDGKKTEPYAVNLP